MTRIFFIWHHCGPSGCSKIQERADDTMPIYGKSFLYSSAREPYLAYSMGTTAEKDIIVALFSNAASLGHARWPYLKKERTFPVPNHDANWKTDSDKASTKRITDKFCTLSTRKDINTEISRIISSIDKKKLLIFYLNYPCLIWRQ